MTAEEAEYIPPLLFLPFGLGLIQKKADSFYLQRHVQICFLMNILVNEDVTEI